MKNKISITLNEGMLKRVDSVVDGLIVRNRSQAIESILKRSFDRNKIAVILLGGPEEKLKIGKQYLPAVEIKKTPLIERTIRRLKEKNFREIFVIARKNVLEAVFGAIKDGRDYGVKINYVEEKSSEGTADSLRHIKNLIKDTFLVLFGDIIFDSIDINSLWDFHLKNINAATLNLITHKNPLIKGEIFVEGNKIIEFNQKPKKRKDENNYIVFSPIFICEPEVLQYPGKSLEEDVFPALAKKELLNGYFSSKSEMHIHNSSDLKKANAI